MKPFETVTITFRESRGFSRPTSVYSEARQGHVASMGEDEYIHEINVDIRDPEEKGADGGTIASADDATSSTSTEDDHDDEEGTGDEQPSSLREVLAPVDAEGNKLAYAIDTSWLSRVSQSKEVRGNDSDKTEPFITTTNAVNTTVTTLNITKAMLSSEAENNTKMQVSVLPSIKVLQLRDNVAVTWHHLQAEQLDFDQFRRACLDVPSLSKRLRTLIQDISAKIEKHNVKPFLGGLYVEPGTVIRIDEKCQSDPQSVIFSCIPYLDISRPVAKTSSTKTKSGSFPARTLMQCAYPHESVRERDAEQAYKKLGGGQSSNVVHVPNMWIMNIGAGVVVTCGHSPLAAGMTRSMEVLQEDLTLLGSKDIIKNALTKIKLVDWDGGVHLYPLVECRTYLQMEQKLDDLRTISQSKTGAESLCMLDGLTLVTPAAWPEILQRSDRVFIDLVALTVQKAKKLEGTPMAHSTGSLISATKTVLPFFHWPNGLNVELDLDELKRNPVSSPNTSHAIQCLESAHKKILGTKLYSYVLASDVEASFTSPKFYEALPEATYEHVDAQFALLKPGTGHSVFTFHEKVLNDQCTEVVKCANDFRNIVEATLRLFVKDLDGTTILRKVWGAMSNIQKLVTALQTRANKMIDAESTESRTQKVSWYVRDRKHWEIAQPEANTTFIRAIKRCRRCKSNRPFDSSRAAVEHLQEHLKPQVQIDTNKALPQVRSDLTDWVLNETQAKHEISNGGALTILKKAYADSIVLHHQFKELAEGVQDEHREFSSLYTFPRRLIEAFRELVIFYLAIERALHYTEKSYHGEISNLPYSEDGLAVLTRFLAGIKRSIGKVRAELRSMVMTDILPDPIENLSLGPEYVCGWLMRRLLVKPLDQHMSIGDLYREYLSTVVSVYRI